MCPHVSSGRQLACQAGFAKLGTIGRAAINAGELTLDTNGLEGMNTVALMGRVRDGLLSAACADDVPTLASYSLQYSFRNDVCFFLLVRFFSLPNFP